MKREKFLFLFILTSAFLLSISFASQTMAQSIDEPIQKITYYAEQYETGNINYAQLIVYMGSLGKDLAEEMGAVSQEHDPILNQKQLESALGEPTEKTKWAWVEDEEQERKLGKEAPAWRKPIFDGNKIQIYLNAWPNIRITSDGEKLIYRLHNDINFKNEEEKIDIKSEIEGIKSLAQKYSSDPTKENLESLAEESASTEQIFNNPQDRSGGKCEETMDDLFGSENKRSTQKIFLQEINFFEGDNFEANIRLEMCDECDWHWMNMNMWFETRGRFAHPEENKNFDNDFRDKYASLTNEDFEQKTKEILDEVKSDLQLEEYQSAQDKMQELRVLTEAWNEKTNNVGQQIEQDFRVDFESMTQEEREKCSKEYCWLKKEQERREAENQLKNSNYEQRKQFYLNLFSEYEKKETYSKQEQWEQKLLQEFKEFGEEICSNNVDDNNNQQIDCSDQQCGGKLCGYDTIAITDETNNTHEEKRELYCIQSACQAKTEIIAENISICGNNICEEKEQETCATDCAVCQQHEALECSGTVIFSGQDANSCALAPICLTENTVCETDNDCADPLCGDSSCVEGTCQLVQLTECREPECLDGSEKVQNCASGDKIVTEKCIEGLWKSTSLKCQEATQGEVQEIAEEIVGNECTVKSDCGNENDVCSNGKCVTIPEIIREENPIEEENQETQGDEDTQESEEEQAEERFDEQGEEQADIQQSPDNEQGNQQEEPSEAIEGQTGEQSPPITGNAVFYFFSSLISGFVAEGEETPSEEPPGVIEEQAEEQNQQEVQQSPDNPEFQDDGERREQNDREREDRERENEDRESEEKERRSQECAERCNRECYDLKVRPCVEKDIREQCGDELECNIDEVRQAGEEACKSNPEVESCVNECSDKCLAGEETWVEPTQKDEHKEEKFVFTAGGACREEQGKLQESINFGGWGSDFRDFHLVKEKYYNHGANDWCEREYNNLIKQRQALEYSLNEEFAPWFFEKYVANSAGDWEKAISGIYDLYWRDVDISRQLVEKSQCLGKSELPPHNLVNFKYETEYGKIEFWEEIKTVPASSIYGGAQNNPNQEQDNKEMQIISQYMKTYLFPSRDFFKLEMKKAMETHTMPGPSEQEARNTPTEEQRQRLIEDDAIERIREFNNEFGENIVIQFKDTQTGEVAFNIYLKVNEKDIIYFEPMLPSELPASDYVKVEYDVEKLLDIIEYGENNRGAELNSPPWDPQPRKGIVKGAVDGVKMYFMFRTMLNSATVTPSSAESGAKDFTRLFFEIALGGGNGENRGPGDGEGDMEENQEGDNQEFEERDPITGQVIQR